MRSLRARLHRIGQRLGALPATLCRNGFPLGVALRAIEARRFSRPGGG